MVVSKTVSSLSQTTSAFTVLLVYLYCSLPHLDPFKELCHCPGQELGLCSAKSVSDLVTFYLYVRETGCLTNFLDNVCFATENLVGEEKQFAAKITKPLPADHMKIAYHGFNLTISNRKKV